MLDHSDFQDTDIPYEVPIPEKLYLPVGDAELVLFLVLITISKLQELLWFKDCRLMCSQPNMMRWRTGYWLSPWEPRHSSSCLWMREVLLRALSSQPTLTPWVQLVLWQVTMLYTILGQLVWSLFTYITCSIARADNKYIHVTVLYSGYPVLSSKIEFKNPGRMANKEDWNKFLTSTKVRMYKCIKIWCRNLKLKQVDWNLHVLC